MINKADIDKIFETVRVEEVVEDYVTLKKRGVNMIGLCPFHDEKTPSFYVSPAKGIYKCFGCGKGGNAVNFVMEKESMSYPEALRTLAKKYNIEIEEKEQTPEQIEANNERERLFVTLSYAQKKFTDNLHNTDEGKSVGLTYFRERGFRDDIIEKFQLGYSINKRKAFTEEALDNTHKIDALVNAGLTIETNNGQDTYHFDRFFGRVMFPIHSATGRVIAFGGRTLQTDKKVAKYVNSPETQVYHKSDVLYGIYFAKKDIINKDNCFLVEGYTDVIALHQVGVENVVASSGTSLTQGQIKLIRRFTKNITILYDGDNAGIKASFRGIDLILEEGLNVKVLLFPDGEDPDSYSKKVSSDELQTFIIENTKDFISFKIDLLLKEAQNDPIKKAGLVKDIVASIALIPDNINRSVYVKECSQLMAMEEQLIVNEVNKARTKAFNDKRRKATSQATEEPPLELASPLPPSAEEEQEDLEAYADDQERKIVELLINYGDSIIVADGADTDSNGNPIPVKVSLAEFIMSEIEGADIVFESALYQEILNEVNTFLNGDADFELTSKHFLNHPKEPINKLAADLTITRHELSRWEDSGIFTTREEDNIKKSALHYIHTLQFKKLVKSMLEIDAQIKACKSDDEMMELLTMKREYEKSKVAISAVLGRIIVK